MVIGLDFLVMIVGLLIFLLAQPRPARWIEVGFAMFCCGLLALLLGGERLVTLFSGTPLGR